MDLTDIKKDLTRSLEIIDSNNYMLQSMLTFIEQQCQPHEIKMVEDVMYTLPIKEYETVEHFIEDYQPIFDLIDFPIADCFAAMKKRKLDWDRI